MIIIITGIITEYNPFHKGHKYHLQQAIKDTNANNVVCIMSGNFMQRGIPALIDKWKRAEIAVRNGVDLVLELPLVYSISSAEHFAFGSVSLLNSLNIIDTLYFGSEIGDIDLLKNISKVLSNEPEEYKFFLKKELNTGLPFHLSRSNALIEYFKDYAIKNVLSNSNNILGIEYIKALNLLNSNIIPATLKRKGGNYNSTDLNNIFSSATSIREYIKNNKIDNTIDNIQNQLPVETYKILKDLSSSNYPFIFEEDMFKYIKYKLLLDGNSLSNLPDVSEGLDNRILNIISNCNSLDELILKSKSKRYTYTRLNRILTQYFLNLEKYDLFKLTKTPTPYARVLAFNSNGRNILKKIKNNSNIQIITKIPKKNLNQHLEIDILGTKAYSLLNNKIKSMDDFLRSPIII